MDEIGEPDTSRIMALGVIRQCFSRGARLAPDRSWPHSALARKRMLRGALPGRTLLLASRCGAGARWQASPQTYFLVFLPDLFDMLSGAETRGCLGVATCAIT